MKTQDALAAGQGGSEPVPVARSGEVLAPQSRDETHRQSAVEALAEYLDDSRAMLACCKAMAKVKRGDRLGPIYAAAKLMNANAQVARALAHVALVEHRSRTIVETIQKPAPKKAELNSRFSTSERGSAKKALIGYIRRLQGTQQAEQERLEDLAIGSCI